MTTFVNACCRFVDDGNQGGHSTPIWLTTRIWNFERRRICLNKLWLLQLFIYITTVMYVITAAIGNPVVCWSDFDTRLEGETWTFGDLCQVSFLLDGVPHHVAGAWQQSKKLAQRDTAERCLGVGCEHKNQMQFTGLLYTHVIKRTESAHCARSFCGMLGYIPTADHWE